MRGNPYPTVYALAQVQVPAAAPPYLWREPAKWKVEMHRDGTCFVGSLFGESTRNLHAVERVVEGLRLLESPEGRQVKILERDYQRLLTKYFAFYGQQEGTGLLHTGNDTLDTSYLVIACRRCGGQGHHSFNLVHADLCYGCGGLCCMVVDEKKQRPLRATATLDSAHAGDIIRIDFVLYLVEEIRWIAYLEQEDRSVNQTVTLRRLIDGQISQQERLGLTVDPSQSILLGGKEVYGCVYVPVRPTADMIGQVVQGPLPLQLVIGQHTEEVG